MRLIDKCLVREFFDTDFRADSLCEKIGEINAEPPAHFRAQRNIKLLALFEW
jgi:hypothetical protein